MPELDIEATTSHKYLHTACMINTNIAFHTFLGTIGSTERVFETSLSSLDYPDGGKQERSLTIPTLRAFGVDAHP